MVRLRLQLPHLLLVIRPIWHKWHIEDAYIKVKIEFVVKEYLNFLAYTSMTIITKLRIFEATMTIVTQVSSRSMTVAMMLAQINALAIESSSCRMNPGQSSIKDTIGP